MVQIVTGFLGKGVHTRAITTLGRGGSDLTATLIGAALDLPEVQVRCLLLVACCCVVCCCCGASGMIGAINGRFGGLCCDSV